MNNYSIILNKNEYLFFYYREITIGTELLYKTTVRNSFAGNVLC